MVMKVINIFISIMVMYLGEVQSETTDLYGNCGEIIRKGSGYISTPTMIVKEQIDICTYIFLRPNTEHLTIGPFQMHKLDNDYEIIVYAGKTNTSTVLLNFTRYYGNESIPSPLHTNGSEVLMTFRRLRLNPENLRNRIYYQSRGPPDNKGNTFVIPEGTSYYITTLKSENISVELLCPEMPMMNFNVSIGNPFSLQTLTPMKMLQGPELVEYSGVSLRAENDLIIFGDKYKDSKRPFLAMPVDVAGNEYYILAIDEEGERIFIAPTEDSAEIKISIPDCLGNCTAYPDCAKKNLNFTLAPCQRVSFSCALHLTGILITSTSPIAVMMDYGRQLIQLPPTKAWGRTFILTSLNDTYGNDTQLKCISKDIETNISITCFNSMVLKMTLVKAGDYAEVTIPSSTHCFISSNKPILPLAIIKGTIEDTVGMIVTPIEQYSNDYILPAQLCTESQSRVLVLTIETSQSDGLRLNGLPLHSDSQFQKVGRTAFSAIYVNITLYSELYYTIRHISRNVVFGALQVCTTVGEAGKKLHVMPLGMRMAPIAETCLQTTSIPGDGIDNDCDGLIDEDICDNTTETNVPADCATNSQEILPCTYHTDSQGWHWPITAPDHLRFQSCLKPETAPANIISEPNKRFKRLFGLGITDLTEMNEEKISTVVDVLTSDSTMDFLKSFLLQNPFTEWPVGMVTNYCELRDGINGVWKGTDRTLCIDEGLSTVFTKLNLLKNGSINDALEDILNETLTVTTRLIDNGELNVGSLESLITSLDLVADVVERRNEAINVAERENFLSVVDKALSIGTSMTWDMLNENSNITNSAAVVMNAVSRFGQQMLVNSTEKGVTLIKDNIVFETRQANIDDVYFPNIRDVTSSAYSNSSYNARLFLSKETIENNLTGSVDYTATYYRTLAQLLPNVQGDNIGSDIVSFSLPQNVTAENLYPAVQIEFEHIYTNETNSTCVFWNFTFGTDGGWSTEGCYAEQRDKTVTTCRCNHLTNFAVLMSASSISEVDTTILTIITWPGCIASIVCLIFTIFLHIYFWRHLKSDKTKILLVLCAVLILAYIILLAGLEQTGDNSKCTAIAIVLHYLFLSALCLMVAEGLEVALTILPAFPQRKSHAIILILFGLVTPLVIVGISMGATSLHGYGTDRYCWLSTSNGLIYAFIVPCFAAVLTNVTITVLIIQRMLSTQAMMKKELKDKVRAGARSIAVLAPILGLTWLFGILAFDKDLVVFSYLFTIFNSLQGLFIFIFHCILNVKMQQSVKRYYDRFVEAHPWAKQKKKDKMEILGVSETIDTTKATETTKA